MSGDALALATIAALAVAARVRSGSLSRSPGGVPTIADLQRAIAAEGSPNVAAKSKPQSVAATFLRMNASDVPDELLVAVLLTGATRHNATEIARKLLSEAGGDLRHVADSIGDVSGVGDIGRARLAAASELYRRAHYRGAARRTTAVTSAGDAVELLKAMALGPYEKLVALYLDQRRRVIASRVLTEGSTGFTIVDPRQVYRPAIALNASAVILAHHHPSGDPQPSNQDIDVTERVIKAGRVLGIPLLDHIVVAGGSPDWVSLAEEGRIAPAPSSGVSWVA